MGINIGAAMTHFVPARRAHSLIRMPIVSSVMASLPQPNGHQSASKADITIEKVPPIYRRFKGKSHHIPAINAG
jgi:hypothetical protein